MQIDVIVQTARMLRLFDEHIFRLNLMYVAYMNNATLMKRLRYHIDSNNYQNCAWTSIYVVLSVKKLDNNFGFHNGLIYIN